MWCVGHALAGGEFYPPSRRRAEHVVQFVDAVGGDRIARVNFRSAMPRQSVAVGHVGSFPLMAAFYVGKGKPFHTWNYVCMVQESDNSQSSPIIVGPKSLCAAWWTSRNPAAW